MSDDKQLLTNRLSFEDAPGEKLVLKQEQYVPDEFLSAIRQEREDSITTPAGEFHKAVSLPIHFVQKYGWDFVLNAPVAEIMKRLRQDQLEEFIATKKAL